MKNEKEIFAENTELFCDRTLDTLTEIQSEVRDCIKMCDNMQKNIKKLLDGSLSNIDELLEKQKANSEKYDA